MSSSRRRQRSVRVSGALVLMLLDTVGVIVALVLGTATALGAACLASLVCGWVVVRLLCVDLQLTWRHAARERAWLADGYRTVITRAADEHTAFAASMSDRAARHDREVQQLEGTVRLLEGRAVSAEDRAAREAARADDARARSLELEMTLAIRRAEEADELASWEPAGRRTTRSWTCCPGRSARILLVLP